MTLRPVALAVALLVPAAAAAQHFHHRVESAPDDDKRVSVCKKRYFDAPAQPDDGIRKVSWNVYTVDTTGNARRFFEQGMTFFYGFDYEDAIRNFHRALDFDSSFAMAHWGLAMAAAPNINLGQDEPCGQMAFDESREAQRLAKLQAGRISALESKLIDALATRYSADPKDRVQAVDYAVAMRGVWHGSGADANRADAAAIYAESLLDLRPWALYDNAYRAAIGTDEVLTVLWSVLERPNAIGANHYFIHAVEAGPLPEAAKDSADLLWDAVPSSSHLLHMPSHTYLLGGDYHKAALANDHAIDVDRRLKDACDGDYAKYSQEPKCPHLYYGHYLAHNLYFRAVSNAFLGNFRDAEKDARATRLHVQRFVANEPGLQRYMTAWLMLSAAYGNWGPILAEEPAPPPVACYSAPFQPTGCRILRSMWHWARGMARTSARPPQLDAARAELQGFRDERDLIAPPQPTGWGNNSAAAVLAVAEETLRARIAWAEGKRAQAVEHLKLAVSHEDALVYDEPPQWMFPARQALGGAYLALGGTANHQEAKRVFCEDLGKHRENGRSLFGMARALQELKEDLWATRYWQRYQKAWQWADPEHKNLDDDALWLLGMDRGPKAETAGDARPEPPGAPEPPDPCPLLASPR